MTRSYLFSVLTAVLLAGCQKEHREQLAITSTLADSANRALVIRTMAAMERNDFAELDKCLTDSFRLTGPDRNLTKQEFYSSIREHWHAFPDWHNTIEEMFFDRNRIFMKVSRGGTHKFDLGDIKATNKRITNPGAYLITIQGNRISSWWALQDDLGMLLDLGMEVRPKKD